MRTRREGDEMAKRGPKKPANHQADQPIKTAVTLSAEMSLRLRRTVVETGRTQSEIMEEALQAHLPRWVVQLRGREDASEPGQSESPGQSLRAVS
jgi:hypothetical protein